MTTNASIRALELHMDAGGGHPFVVFPVLLRDDKDAILVDTGIPGQLERIRSVLERESVPLGKLTKIIITHQDRDHIGSLPELIEAIGGSVKVFAHELCAPYIRGELPLIKSGVTVPPSKVDTTVQDGDMLPYCGGIRVIFTPGHTPDHISLYHEPSKTLISGDALTSQDGELMPPNPQYTPDPHNARLSVAKLAALPIDTVITYHGGICKDRIRERLVEIAGK